MRKFFKFLVFLLPISAMIYSCYPEYDATIEELDLAITKYDEDQDFTQLNSYYLYDTIIYITDDEDADPPDLEEGHGPLIISEVRKNLLELGWREEVDTIGGVQADVSILISVLKTDVNFYYYGWWDWWYWYPWYPGYPGYPGSPGYPGYPGSYPTYGYTVGTVLVDMANMNEIVAPTPGAENPKFEIPLVWTGAVNGILAGSDQNIGSRITKEIDQIFEQSTYLHK